MPSHYIKVMLPFQPCGDGKSSDFVSSTCYCTSENGNQVFYVKRKAADREDSPKTLLSIELVIFQEYIRRIITISKIIDCTKYS